MMLMTEQEHRYREAGWVREHGPASKGLINPKYPDAWIARGYSEECCVLCIAGYMHECENIDKLNEYMIKYYGE